MATTTRTRSRRTTEDWEALAQELLPQIQEGTSIEDLRDRIGTNVEALKIALARSGYDPDGKPNAFKPITATTPKALAKKVAARRREKTPWWRIQAETSMTYTALISLVRDQGYALDGSAETNGDSGS